MLSQAIRLFEKGALARAEDALLDAVQASEDPQEVQTALLYLARLCFSMGRDDEAQEYVAQAMPMEEVPLKLAERLLSEGHPRVAEGVAREAVRREPGDLDAYLMLGHALSALDKMPGAIQAYEHAVKLGPRESAPRYFLAQALLWIGEFARAGSQVQTLLQTDPRHEAGLLMRADLAFLQGDNRQAAVDYQKAVEAGAMEPEVFERLAMAYWNLGETRRALDVYEAAMATYSTHWGLYEAAALLCEEAGWYRQARRFHRALTFEPSRRDDARASIARLEGLEDQAPMPPIMPIVVEEAPKAPPSRESVTARLRKTARGTGNLARPGGKIADDE